MKFITQGVLLFVELLGGTMSIIATIFFAIASLIGLIIAGGVALLTLLPIAFVLMLLL